MGSRGNRSDKTRPGSVSRRDGCVLFWSGWPSNWYPCQFTVEGHTFNCGEQWMMYAKARLFGDEERMRLILEEPSPRNQKALGRLVRPFDDRRWKAEARDLVYIGLLEKFRQNEDLRAKLLETGDDLLVEASPVDRRWGIGLDASDPRATRREQWRGANWLGEVLMRVRQTIRAGGAASCR